MEALCFFGVGNSEIPRSGAALDSIDRTLKNGSSPQPKA
jgi:hypothetical protein